LAEGPGEMNWTDGSGVEFNTIGASNEMFFDELWAALQGEAEGCFDPHLVGAAATLGIVDGAPFAPSEALRQELRDISAVGNSALRALWFRPPESAYLFPNSTWTAPFQGGDYRWYLPSGGFNLDARARFFFAATFSSPSMAGERVGVGSQYAVNNLDSSGEYLDGASAYVVNIPADPPARDFWSITAYDPQSRSELRTSQPFPAKNSVRNPLVANDDGSVDIYFGPEPPSDPRLEPNWIETVPGKGFFVLLRLYGPLAPWFDQTWVPGEMEPL